MEGVAGDGKEDMMMMMVMMMPAALLRDPTRESASKE